MDIQKILLPRVGICSTNGMYFRSTNQKVYDMANECLRMGENDIVGFDTFFNSVSIGKWRKYTVLENLTLTLEACGAFEITLEHWENLNNTNVHHFLLAKEFHLAERRGTGDLHIQKRGIYQKEP